MISYMTNASIYQPVTFLSSEYCQLTYQDVLRELRYQPLDQVLGTSADDNLEVYYGINMTDGDILEEGVKVFGHCYVWLVIL